MTTPHPHADFFRAIADGEPLDNWECRYIAHAGNSWAALGSCLGAVFHSPSDYEVRRKPTPKVIDWSKLGRHVPVALGEAKNLGYLEKFNPDMQFPFYAPPQTYKHASLDTGLWVPNVDGENHWPEGVLVTARLKGGSVVGPRPACRVEWFEFGCSDDVMCTRFHSLEDGFTFGGDQ